MSTCLAVDTATSTGTVALAVDGKIVADGTFVDRQHAAQLLPNIMQCLQAAGLQPNELDEVIVADGPGSFTGLRIGFATVAGLMAHSGQRLFVAPSLMALAVAAGSESDGPSVAMYDALRGEVYAGCYRVCGTAVETLYAPHVTTISSLRQLDVDHPVVAVGAGATAYADDIHEWIGSYPLDQLPHAKNLIALRPLQNALVEVGDLSSFEVSYGRKAEAQVRWEREHGRKLSDTLGST